MPKQKESQFEGLSGSERPDYDRANQFLSSQPHILVCKFSEITADCGGEYKLGDKANSSSALQLQPCPESGPGCVKGEISPISEDQAFCFLVAVTLQLEGNITFHII